MYAIGLIEAVQSPNRDEATAAVELDRADARHLAPALHAASVTAICVTVANGVVPAIQHAGRALDHIHRVCTADDVGAQILNSSGFAESVKRGRDTETEA